MFTDWKKVKLGKKEPRVRGEHDFSVRLEATKKDGVQTGENAPPKMRPVPPDQSPLQRAHKPVGDQSALNPLSKLLRLMFLKPDRSRAHRKHRRRDHRPDGQPPQDPYESFECFG